MSLKVWLFLHGHLILGISIGVIVVSMIFFARFSDAKKTWIAGGTAVLATLMCFAVGVPYTQAPQKSLLSHFGHETVFARIATRSTWTGLNISSDQATRRRL